MTEKLPHELRALFAPRPPLRWVEAVDKRPEQRRTRHIDGVGAFLSDLKEYNANEISEPTESWLERRDRKKQDKKEAIKELATLGPKQCGRNPLECSVSRTDLCRLVKPEEDPNVRGNALSTMVVARLSYEADERDLERHFGRFGPIERVRLHRTSRQSSTADNFQIRIVKDTHAHEKPGKKKKPHRGYAFVVFEREKDMQGKPSPTPLPWNSGTKRHERPTDARTSMWPSGLPVVEMHRETQRALKLARLAPLLLWTPRQAMVSMANVTSLCATVSSCGKSLRW